MKAVDQDLMLTPRVSARDAIAIIGVGAILPGAPGARGFWQSVREGKYLIREVPADRWSVESYFDPDPAAPDKTYSKLGAFVEGFAFDYKRFRIPPRTVQSMDCVQQWAMAAAGEALEDAGYLGRDYDRERTAVILGNSMAGEMQLVTSARVLLPEVVRALEKDPSFAALPEETQRKIVEGMRARVSEALPPVTEDTMPGELSNVISGRVANAFDLGGANHTVDAACASSLAAISTAVNGLRRGEYDMVLTGGADRTMSPPMYVKFCKIGALSAEGSFPFDARASGFVMGEGCAVFLLKRYADAARDGDRVLSIILGVGSSSDGRGKGIAAPNKRGQIRALERAYETAGVRPGEIDLIEAHGTSTRVGDPIEVEALSEIFDASNIGRGRVALGSVKSQIGHLKSAAGAAAVLKVTMALSERILPPSVNFVTPNPSIPFDRLAFRVPVGAEEWRNGSHVRRAAVSAFGFGGTNFHVILQEPPRDGADLAARKLVPGADLAPRTDDSGKGRTTMADVSVIEDLLSMVSFMGTDDPGALLEALRAGRRPAPLVSLEQVEAFCRMPCRLAVSHAKGEEIEKKIGKLLEALRDGFDPSRLGLLERQGVHVGVGPAMKVGYLFPGQGSQSVGMLRDLRDGYQVFRSTFEQADRIMEPILGHSLSDVVYGAGGDMDAAVLEERLRQTEVTQPAMLAVDIAMVRLLEQAGLRPDMVVGHSLGEYAALVCAGVLDLSSALEIVAARGREMAAVSLADPGRMVAAMADADTVERLIARVDGYLTPANKNSSTQTVVAGESAAVEKLLELFEKESIRAVPLRVSHAFHSRIVAPASEPLRRVLERQAFHAAAIPVFTNVGGKAYPDGAGKDVFVGTLAEQIASPVEFVACVRNMYEAGARLFIEVGPRRVLASFAEDILSGAADAVKVACTNNHRQSDLVGLASMYAAACAAGAIGKRSGTRGADGSRDAGGSSSPRSKGPSVALAGRREDEASVVVSGSAIGLPGRGSDLFTDDAVEKMLAGTNFLEPVPGDVMEVFPLLNMTSIDKGNGEEIVERKVASASDAIKLAGMVGRLDLSRDYGIDRELAQTMDTTARMAVAAGLEALRDAGIPLVLETRTTSKGTVIPVGWVLPETLRSETGVIFASCFPGYDRFARELEAYHEHRLAGRPYAFDRKILFGILAMGHAQFAQSIRARGPCLQVNAACASSALAVATACDWMASGRCKRVVVLSADETSSPHLLPWIGGGFLANGAAATDPLVEDAALPFDERRHGLLIGAGAAALVLEVEDEVRARGAAPLARIVHTQISNSAFHGTRLDSSHIAGETVRFLSAVERKLGMRAADIADRLVFLSHETYTPARGGSADTEVEALRAGFGTSVSQVLVANTKGYTGHPMGTGFEDALAPWILHTGRVPPIANLSRTDPRFAELNLSRGGSHDVEWVMRFSAGFGSQVAMILFEKATAGGRRLVNDALNKAWLEGLLGGRPARLEVGGRVLHLVEDDARDVRTESRSAAPADPAPRAEVPARGRDLLSEVLALISSKTGYPEDMLDPTLDMEADLGIDTVKQAELFAEIRRAYSIPRQENLKLSDYRTINDVVGFVSSFAGRAGAAPEPSPEPAEVPATGRDLLGEIVAIVADKTGYPADMLDPTLDMEADLGIDTVKQAELFAEIRRAYSIPRQENLKLSDYRTIDDVVGFVSSFAGRAGAAPEPSPEPAEVPATGRDLLGEIVAIVADKTGYPADMIDPTMNMEADLGIDTVKQAELFAEVRRIYSIPRQENLRLTDYPTIEHVVAFVRAFASGVEPLPPLPGAEPTEIVTVAPPAPVPGVDAFEARVLVPTPAWLPPASAFGPTGRAVSGGSDPVVLHGSGPVRDAIASLLASRSVPVSDGSGSGPVRGLVLVDSPPSLDVEGLDDACARVVDSAVDRFRLVKDLVASERLGAGFVIGVTSGPGALSGFVKSLSHELHGSLVKVVDLDSPGSAGRIIDEIEHDPQTTEISYRAGQRWGVTLEETAPPSSGPSRLPSRPVVLMTGGAGGIMVEIGERLASRHSARVVLLDVLDPAAGSPRILQAIERIEKAGGTAVYVRADATDPASVDRAVETAMARFGRIDAVLHGAGIEESRAVHKKSEETFRKIVSVKVRGAGNLVHSVLARTRPATFLFFSSVAGRFGNAGQADYSAGNDFLSKIAPALSSAHPGTRFMAVDWTAWDGPGMAGSSAIRAVLDEAGIQLLSRAEGTELASRFVADPAPLPAEVVVARSLGVLEERILRAESREVSVREGRCPGRACWRSNAVSWTFNVDPASSTWLWDHAVDGTPVFPAVMGLETFVQMGTTLLGAPLCRIEGVRLHRAVKFFSGQPRELRVVMEPELLPGGGISALLRLDTESRHRMEGGRTLNFEARLIFGSAAGAEVMTRGRGVDLEGWDSSVADDAQAVYRHLFHGPGFQVLSSFSIGGPHPEIAMGRLSGAALAPKGLYRLTELGMQTCGMWLLRSAGTAALPASVEAIHVLGALDGPCHAVSVYRGSETRGAEGVHHRFDVTILSGSSTAVWIEGLALVETGARPEARLSTSALPNGARTPVA